MTVSIESLHGMFDFDQNSGILTRKITTSSNSTKGSEVGAINSHGYLQVKINRTTYKVHRIVIAMHNGEWPDGVVDHINCVRTDNRLCNLRITTVSGNNRNQKIRSDNKTGVKGVTWHKRDKKFNAACWANRKQVYLGSFDSIDDAKNIVSKFRFLNHGEFARQQ